MNLLLSNIRIVHCWSQDHALRCLSSCHFWSQRGKTTFCWPKALEHIWACRAQGPAAKGLKDYSWNILLKTVKGTGSFPSHPSVFGGDGCWTAQLINS